jgi:hypothetical protein
LRKEVDEMFHEALIADGVGPVKALCIYWGVRLGGWAPWLKHHYRKVGFDE